MNVWQEINTDKLLIAPDQEEMVARIIFLPLSTAEVEIQTSKRKRETEDKTEILMKAQALITITYYANSFELVAHIGVVVVPGTLGK